MRAALLALVAGCTVAVNAERTEGVFVPVTGGFRRLVVDSAAGDVTVYEGEGPVRAELRWAEARPALDVTRRGDALEITLRCAGSPTGCEGDLDIPVPPGASLEVSTGLGDVYVLDVHSPEIIVVSGAGEVQVDDLDAPDAIVVDVGEGDVGLYVPAGTDPAALRATTRVGDVVTGVSGG